LELRTAQTSKEINGRLGLSFIFKSSFDKANRKSGKAFRGLGMEKGLRILELVKKEVFVPVLTDVNEDAPAAEESRASSTCCRRPPFGATDPAPST
jgi:2-dehydro-3-deoxyphosphooctonate aldolase (KDO 8-P synthase)